MTTIKDIINDEVTSHSYELLEIIQEGQEKKAEYILQSLSECLLEGITDIISRITE